ncbi:MAG: ATP-binding protein [Planctomycetota bacterium]
MTDEAPNSSPVSIGMRLPSLMFLTRPLREFLALSLKARGFDEEWIEEFGLAVTELVNNSFEHASPSEWHEVAVDLTIHPDRVEFRIRDEGEGAITQADFDFEGKGPPDHFEDRGRGLFLISCFSDDVIVQEAEEGGTAVTITKFRGGMER